MPPSMQFAGTREELQKGCGEVLNMFFGQLSDSLPEEFSGEDLERKGFGEVWGTCG